MSNLSKLVIAHQLLAYPQANNDDFNHKFVEAQDMLKQYHFLSYVYIVACGNGKYAVVTRYLIGDKRRWQLTDIVCVLGQEPRVVGGHYWCSYWRYEYSVQAISGLHITVKAETLPSTNLRDDPSFAVGRVFSHCTSWDWHRDLIVSHPGN